MPSSGTLDEDMSSNVTYPPVGDDGANEANEDDGSDEEFADDEAQDDDEMNPDESDREIRRDHHGGHDGHDEGAWLRTRIVTYCHYHITITQPPSLP